MSVCTSCQKKQCKSKRTDFSHNFIIIIIIIIIIIFFFRRLGRLNCSGIDALPSFPRASTISSSSRFVVEGVFRQSRVVHSFKMVDPVLFVFVSHFSRSHIFTRDLSIYFSVCSNSPKLTRKTPKHDVHSQYLSIICV